MTQSGGNFLDDLLFGVKNVQDDGVTMPEEPTINFVGAVLVDDPVNHRTNVNISANPHAVSGTGFWHSTSGTLDAAASLVNLSTDTTGILPLTDLAQSGAGVGYVLAWNGSQYAPTSSITSAVTAAMAGEVTGTTGSSVVSGPFATASLSWKSTVTAPVWTQAAATSDVVPQPLKISAQAPYSAAVTHVDASNVTVNVPPSISGATKFGGFEVDYNDTALVLSGAYSSGTALGSIWFGGNAVSPSLTNYGFLDGSSNTQVNAPLGGNLLLEINSSPLVNLTSTQLAIGTYTAEQILISVGLSTPTIQSSTTSTSFTFGTNKSGASTVLQADAATTIQTLSATGTELANLSTPAAGTGPRLLGSSGRFEVVDSDGTVRIF